MPTPPPDWLIAPTRPELADELRAMLIKATSSLRAGGGPRQEAEDIGTRNAARWALRGGGGDA